MHARLPASLAVAVALAGGVAAAAEAPLSAIDWLSDSIRSTAPTATDDTARAVPPPPPVRAHGLEAARLDAAGLFPAERIGLSAAFWGPTTSASAAAAIAAVPFPAPRPVTRLLRALLLAEAQAPTGPGAPDGALLLARVDRLIEMGMLDDAVALIGRAGRLTPALFRRWFDAALLTGHEARACTVLNATPGVSPSIPARIFCLARGGDWSTALLTLQAAEALGLIEPLEAELLARFLDAELADGAEALPRPERMTPLLWRLYEAIGEAQPTEGLPLAFAHLDLRPISGWKARLQAAERLARVGTLSPARLLAVYTERLPAASGGVWERVRAVQALDAALVAGDRARVRTTLPEAAHHMAEVGLLPVLAAMQGERLARLGPAEDPLTLRLVLLSGRPDLARARFRPRDPALATAFEIARGLAPNPPAEASALLGAVAGAFSGAVPEPAGLQLLTEGRQGEALLAALATLGQTPPDPAAAPAALTTLRALGLERQARSIAIAILLTPPADGRPAHE